MSKRILDRREFLKSAGTTAAVVVAAAGGTMIVATNRAWAMTLEVLAAPEAEALLHMARRLYPHDMLGDVYYAEVVEALDEKAKAQPELVELVKNGVAALDQATGVPFVRLSPGTQTEVLKRLETTRVPSERAALLPALGRFEDPALRERALRYALSGALRANEVFTAPLQMTTTSAGRDRLYQWVTDNYERIASVLPPPYMAYLPFSAGGCEPERLEKAKAFFSQPAHQVEGTAEELQHVLTDRVFLGQRFEHELPVAGDHREHVVEVVRDATGEEPDRFHLLRLGELALHETPLRDVAQHDDTADGDGQVGM